MSEGKVLGEFDEYLIEKVCFDSGCFIIDPFFVLSNLYHEIMESKSSYSNNNIYSKYALQRISNVIHKHYEKKGSKIGYLRYT